MAGNRNHGLDLVRAAAVLAVVGIHLANMADEGATKPFFAVGGIAVEMFYALSGFLIGRILLEVAGSPSPASWLRFMSRRWARTMPLYAAVLAVAVCLARPDAAEALRFALMAQNVTGPLPHDRLGAFMATSWSLTVEEMFYGSFATALLLASALAGRRAAWPVTIAFMAVPPILRAMTYGQDQAYFAAVLNLDGIAWGVALALLERDGSALFRHPAACLAAGCALVASAWWPYAAGILSMASEWQPGTLTVAAAGCCLIVAAALRMGDPGRAGAAIRAVSLRSYSLYLVHWLVLTVASTVMDAGIVGAPAAIGASLAGTAALAWATHRWIEIPGMKLAHGLPRRAAALPSRAIASA